MGKVRISLRSGGPRLGPLDGLRPLHNVEVLFLQSADHAKRRQHGPAAWALNWALLARVDPSPLTLNSPPLSWATSVERIVANMMKIGEMG